MSGVLLYYKYNSYRWKIYYLNQKTCSTSSMLWFTWLSCIASQPSLGLFLLTGPVKIRTKNYGDIMKENKTCSKCGEEKPATVEFFHRHRKGLNSACKVCIAEYQQANREKIAERKKRYGQANREKIAERKKRYGQANRETKAEYDKQSYQTKIAVQPACVYQIVNKQNGRIYVGQTFRGELRWRGHLKSLRGGYHDNPNLQKDFNKFGQEVFDWSIIKELPKDREVLAKEEKLHIDKIIAEGKNLYNILLIT
jgi:hypothetical protein